MHVACQDIQRHYAQRLQEHDVMWALWRKSLSQRSDVGKWETWIKVSWMKVSFVA